MIDEIDMLNFNSNLDPRVKVCDDCGSKIQLTAPLDNDCQCGACYNLSGQRVMSSDDCRWDGHPLEDVI